MSKQSLDELLNRLQARDFYDAIQAIEKLGASEELTAAVNAVGKLMRKYGNHVRTREETEAAIVEAVEGLAPKKQFVPKYTPQDKFPKGYNAAVDDFLQAIKEWQ